MSAFTNNKLVIAVDPDINIYYGDVMYALPTRVDPARDVITVDHTRGWIFDPKAHSEVAAGPSVASTRLPATASRWGISVTKPPTYRRLSAASTSVLGRWVGAALDLHDFLS
jgi:3-polyprenyl-4-hydroxybenzoate decarboxylase